VSCFPDIFPWIYIPIQNYQALFFWRIFLLLHHDLLFFSCLIMSWHKHSSKCMAFVHWRYHKVSSVHIYKNFKYRTLHYIIELRVQSSTTLFQLSRIILSKIPNGTKYVLSDIRLLTESKLESRNFYRNNSR